MWQHAQGGNASVTENSYVVAGFLQEDHALARLAEAVVRERASCETNAVQPVGAEWQHIAV